MSKQRHRRRSQGGTTPETTPQTDSGVAQFSVSEVAQFSMSLDTGAAKWGLGMVRLVEVELEPGKRACPPFATSAVEPIA
jgi:hypothetical protein